MSLTVGKTNPYCMNTKITSISQALDGAVNIHTLQAGSRMIVESLKYTSQGPVVISKGKLKKKTLRRLFLSMESMATVEPPNADTIGT